MPADADAAAPFDCFGADDAPAAAEPSDFFSVEADAPAAAEPSDFFSVVVEAEAPPLAGWLALPELLAPPEVVALPDAPALPDACSGFFSSVLALALPLPDGVLLLAAGALLEPDALPDVLPEVLPCSELGFCSWLIDGD